MTSKYPNLNIPMEGDIKTSELLATQKENVNSSKKPKNSRKKSYLEQIQEFWGAPDPAFFGQQTISLVRGVSESTLENERWRGCGISYRKINGRVLYRKSDVVAWLESYELINSSSDYKKEI